MFPFIFNYITPFYSSIILYTTLYTTLDDSASADARSSQIFVAVQLQNINLAAKVYAFDSHDPPSPQKSYTEFPNVLMSFFRILVSFKGLLAGRAVISPHSCDP